MTTLVNGLSYGGRVGWQAMKGELEEMPKTTVQATVHVPKPMIETARDRWGDVAKPLSTPQLIRFAFAKAIGATDAEALAATRDARIGTTRKPITE